MGRLADRPRARLTLTTTPQGVLCLRLDGELDLASMAELGPALYDLLARSPQPLELDLAELTFLDSSGVAVLIRLANHFALVSIREITPPVRQVLDVLGLGWRFGLDGVG